MKWCICISGKGGQGIRRAGECLANAALLKGMNVIQTSSYTPEVRGGNSITDIIISDEEIDYPLIEKIDILIALNKNGYLLNIHRIDRNSSIMYDSGLLSLSDSPKTIGIPFQDIAKKELGKAIFSNMIALGVLIQITDIVPAELVLKAIKKRTDRLTDNSVRAFRMGLELGRGIDEGAVQGKN